MLGLFTARWVLDALGQVDYICLTDMAGGRGDDVRAADVIKTGCERAIHWNF